MGTELSRVSIGRDTVTGPGVGVGAGVPVAVAVAVGGSSCGCRRCCCRRRGARLCYGNEAIVLAGHMCTTGRRR